MEYEGMLTCLQQPAVEPILNQMNPVHILLPYFT
jgi:hypothetical protein